MADPAWQGGHYYGTGRKPDAGMGIARMVGHITYLSAKSVGDKFGRRLQFAEDIRYTVTDPEFAGRKLPAASGGLVRQTLRREHLSLHVASADLLRPRAAIRQRHAHGRASRRCQARTLLIAFSSDWLYPPAGSEELADALRALGKDVELHVIDAPYGHDCFLLEEARQTPMIQNFLARREN